MIDLNDQLANANGVAGRKQTVHTAGLNWYVNRNVRFMFNYPHGDIAKQVSATNVGDVGAKFDAFAQAAVRIMGGYGMGALVVGSRHSGNRHNQLQPKWRTS